MNAIDVALASYAALWILVAFQSALLIATIRTTGLVLSRLPPTRALRLDDEGPPVGAALRDGLIDGLRFSASQRRGLLIFLSTTCSLCLQLASAAAALQASGVPLRVFIKGSDEDALPIRHALGSAASATTVGDSAFGLAQIQMTPFAIVVDTSGHIVTKGLANTLQQLESLLLAKDGGQHDHRNVSDDHH